jgi:acetyltransferase
MASDTLKQQLDYFFKPQSVAVIGATSKEFTIGRAILHNMVINEFNGKIFPVNPKAEVIHSLKCYRSVLEIPDSVDMAVIMVKKELVAETLEQCGQKGIKAAITITSGFKEIGGAGVAEEKRILEIAQKHNIRMIGPNCFGIFNTAADISLNATFSKTKPRRGKVAFISQSGALGEAILDYAYQIGLGFSLFASIGNKADLTENDFLEYLENDPNTEIILLYMENFADAKGFSEIASRVARKKPILAIKSGRSQAGAKAISSHTGVLATPDAGVQAMFEQCGIIRVETVDELFDFTLAYVHQPLPKSNRVGIITNAGGPGIMATDAAVKAGLEVAPLTEETTKYLRANLSDMAAVGNPIDVIASGGADSYRAAMEACFSDPNVDSIICIFVPPIVTDHLAVNKAIAETIDKHKNSKPVVGCFMNVPQIIAGSDELIKRNIPIYTFPEAAARAVSGMVRYRNFRNRSVGKIPSYQVDKQAVARIIDNAVKSGTKAIMGQEAIAILEAYGINTAKTAPVKTLEQLKELSPKIGYPQVMKLDDPSVIHKTDVGGVALNLKSLEEATAAFNRMAEKLSGPTGFAGVIIQQMIKGGVETIMGMNRDSSFGPLLMFGLGGVSVEIMKDVAFRVYPLTDYDADAMIHEIKGFKLLSGFRGSKPSDLETLKDTILRLSQLSGDFPQIESLDLNPFLSGDTKANSVAVDARFILKI